MYTSIELLENEKQRIDSRFDQLFKDISKNPTISEVNQQFEGLKKALFAQTKSMTVETDRLEDNQKILKLISDLQLS